MTKTQKIIVSKFKRGAHIPCIIEKNLILLQSSINEEEEIGIYRTNLITLKKIEYVKREFRKALGLTGAYDRSCDNNTHFKIHSERSKSIGGASNLIVWTDDIDKYTEQL